MRPLLGVGATTTAIISAIGLSLTAVGGVSSGDSNTGTLGAVSACQLAITRTVMRDGGVLFQDDFTTHYQPWQAVCQYGPDSKNPEKLADEKNLCRNPAG